MADDELTDFASLLDLPPEALGRLLPAPVRYLGYHDGRGTEHERLPEGVWVTAGEPVLVVVGVAIEGPVVAVPRISWEGPYTPVLTLASIRRAPDVAGQALQAWLGEHIRGAGARRRAHFEICDRCRETIPPERMLSERICMGCAEQDGVVF